MAKIKTEYEVEQFFIDLLEKQGYTYLDMKNYDDVLRNFREQFCRFNSKALIEAKGVDTLSDAEFEKVMLRLDNHTVYESAKILREKWVLDLDNGKSIYIDFLSNDLDRNIYQVTHQITMDKEHVHEVEYKNRYDVTIFINGLPLVQIELKRSGVELNEAINQINRYRAFSFKRLFRYIQIFVVSNTVQTKYFANANERKPDGTEQLILKSLAFYWTDKENVRINKLPDFTVDFLNKYAITELLTRYMVIKETEPILMVMRPYQVWSIRLAMDRILRSNLNGYIFHTTGSGKTLTSYKLASLLRDNNKIDKVFFLIDRKDLDDQTVDEYNSFEVGCVDNTDSTYTLVKDLQNTEKKLIITTIQKMANAVKNPRYQKVMEEYKNKKCVFIIDECHRSQFGKMHGDIKRHFLNSNYIGFTGTPIFEENKGSNPLTTADMFYAGQLNACIHKYMIKEAIADGNVLRFSVEYMRSVNIKNQEDTKYDASRIDDPLYCKENNIDMDGIYHSKDRISQIAKDILRQLENHIRPAGKDIYTSIFAVDRIQTLMDYYHEFKKQNDKGYKICAIFTYKPNEDLSEGQDEHSQRYLKECIEDYNAIFKTSFSTDTFDAYRKDIAKRLKQRDLPQVDLLIVVDMFLTGFDSKPTNTLFLDKNLVYHSLVQAYSRTNRVDKPTKQFGQIITYRNIKKAQDQALSLFSGSGNPDDYLLKTYEFYVNQYGFLVAKIKNICSDSDKCAKLESENDQKEFVKTFRELSKVLAAIKTFSKFDWADLDVFMPEDEYSEYKSCYLNYFDKQRDDMRAGKESILSNVDFSLELIRTDKINVVYILNLIEEANKKHKHNKEDLEKAMDLILREIDRSDNEKLRYKINIMKEFIKTKRYLLYPNDIKRGYEEFEKEMMDKDILSFAKEKKVEEGLVSSLVYKYLLDKESITNNKLSSMLLEKVHLPIKERASLKKDIVVFLEDMYNKYTVEGE